jgi:branched-chain amino acid transport system permease protein
MSAWLTIPDQTKQIVLLGLPTILTHAHLSAVVALLAAGSVCALLGLVASIPLMRLSGIAAGIATLALLEIVRDVLVNDIPLTGAAAGAVTGVPTDTPVGSALIWVVIMIWVAWGSSDRGTAFGCAPRAKTSLPRARSGLAYSRSGGSPSPSARRSPASAARSTRTIWGPSAR